MSEERLAVVAGSLGDQGGAVARALAAAGRRVRALSHDVDSKAARELRSGGVEVVADDLNDASRVRLDLQGADEVFGALTPFDEGGLEAEERQVRNLAAAAAELQTRRVVYSSVGDPEIDKSALAGGLWGVERILRGFGLPLTLLRPAFFMENLDEFALRRRDGGIVELRMPLDPHTRLQWIAVEDVGALVVRAFDDQAAFSADPVELATDERTLLDAMRLLTDVFGWRVRYVRIGLDEVRRQSEHAHGMYRWFQAYAAYQADIPAIRRVRPDALTLRQWLEGDRLDRSKLGRDVAA
jgi:uncharacterized protein YbjT (DUF2867 family)